MSSWCSLIEVKQARSNASLYGILGKIHARALLCVLLLRYKMDADGDDVRSPFKKGNYADCGILVTLVSLYTVIAVPQACINHSDIFFPHL